MKQKGLNYLCMIVCIDEAIKRKNALFESENKIWSDTSKDEYCQTAHLACLKRGHTL